MTSIKTRGVAALLALALVAVTVPLAPAAAQDSGSPSDRGGSCDADERTRERGWIGVSHPGVNQNIRVSQTLYLRLFDQGFAPSTVAGIPLDNWVNGQDAYVVELPCTTTGSETFCVERLDPIDDRNSFVGIPLLQPQDHDYRVAFYGPAIGYQEKGDIDVEAQDSLEDCDTFVPENAEFAVVYLASGTVSGIQIDDQLYGPYTEHFNFGFTGNKASFGS